MNLLFIFRQFAIPITERLQLVQCLFDEVSMKPETLGDPEQLSEHLIQSVEYGKQIYGEDDT